MSPVTSVTPQVVAEDDDWQLEVSITESSPVVAELLRSTDDNCGGTCGSACTSCRS